VKDNESGRNGESPPTYVLPEIREADPPVQIAALYADMRAVMGVPMVNLIYRHIATVPNGLAWVWSALRPHIAAGTMGSLAEAVLAHTASEEWNEASPIAALPAAERRAISSIVSWYNRGNAINLTALLALRSASIRRARQRNEAAITVSAQVAELAVPPPLKLADLEPSLHARIATVCDRQGLTGTGITPTMYLHLARWPVTLAAILDSVERVIDSGAFERSVTSVIAVAQSSVCELSEALVACEEPPDQAGRVAINAVIETFTTKAIPQMLLVGTHIVDLH
jgi:hypothetical protein